MSETITLPEISNQLFLIVEDKAMFEPIESINQGQYGHWLSFEEFADTDDGTFPRVSDYIRIINKIDSDGASAFLNWIGRKNKLKIDTGYCTVIREADYEIKAILKFKEPITVVIGYVNKEPVTIKTDEIHGEFSYEWGWRKNGRQDQKANTCEIFFDCKEYFLSEDQK